MIFSKQAIQQVIRQKKLIISPFTEEQIEAAHINLHLSTPDGKPLVMKPKSFMTAKTKEKIALSKDLCAFIEGRASVAKQGISVEQSSTFIEPGSNNHMVLEMFNASDDTVELRDGQEIAKMFVMAVVNSTG